jgi:hypothetical protein
VERFEGNHDASDEANHRADGREFAIHDADHDVQHDDDARIRDGLEEEECFAELARRANLGDDGCDPIARIEESSESRFSAWRPALVPPIFLNIGGKYPNQAFTAFIPSASAAQFSNPQQYEGRTVAVSGKIALYKGKPEIIVNSPSQISTK